MIQNLTLHLLGLEVVDTHYKMDDAIANDISFFFALWNKSRVDDSSNQEMEWKGKL